MKSTMEIKITDEFASAMQQLSAEAEKTLPENSWDKNQNDEQFARIIEEFRRLNGRMTSFEQIVLGRLEKLEKAEQSDFAEQFRKMDENMAALRNTETVNQRLFDSLHDEMIKYRDNFLHESLQKPFIRDLIVLFDDLSAAASQLENAGERVPAKARQNVENTLHALLEVLHRLEVSEMDPLDRVDRKLHKVASYEP